MDFDFEDLSNNTIIADENHHNISFEAGELELNTIQWVIILIFWILLQTLGNGLLVGMIVYERVGNGDPLKRRIIDQVCFDFESFIYDEKTIEDNLNFLALFRGLLCSFYDECSFNKYAWLGCRNKV